MRYGHGISGRDKPLRSDGMGGGVHNMVVYMYRASLGAGLCAASVSAGAAARGVPKELANNSFKRAAPERSTQARASGWTSPCSERARPAREVRVPDAAHEVHRQDSPEKRCRV